MNLATHVIQTEYRGIRFRSRREARWAVFMDELGVVYEYEPEGFDFGSVCYLPDFWLPQLDCYIEIKGTTPTEPERHKALLLSQATGKRVFIFFDPPRVPQSCGYEESAYTPGDWGYWWCECPRCRRVDIQFNGRAERIPCNCPKSDRYNFDSPRLLQAYQMAAGARFYD